MTTKLQTSFKRHFGRVSSVYFQVLMIKKGKSAAIHKSQLMNGNIQSHNQEECKLNNTINANSGGEHIGTSPLTKKQIKPKNSSVADHLLFCNHSASHDDFSIIMRESKFLLELKSTILNRNITSTSLYLFN